MEIVFEDIVLRGLIVAVVQAPEPRARNNATLPLPTKANQFCLLPDSSRTVHLNELLYTFLTCYLLPQASPLLNPRQISFEATSTADSLF